MSSKLRFIDSENPINRIDSKLLSRMRRAQDELLENEFSNSRDFAASVLADLKLDCDLPAQLAEQTPSELTDVPFDRLTNWWRETLLAGGHQHHAALIHAVNLAQQSQLKRAFAQPEKVLLNVEDSVKKVVEKFPRKAADIECGKNPGDVLDPYILAATQFLLCKGEFEEAIEHIVSHKALMMIEGLLGHLHEDVVSMMRGNVRVPEPRGADQESINPDGNPFPGADMVQPPWSEERQLSFHQIKSKTGSAKGGDGRRLGEQLSRLVELYGGDVYYHALVGNTLRGHRSKAGVERAYSDVVVLVGQASFEVLTGTPIGPELLLRLYQAAFQEVAVSTDYRVADIAHGVVESFRVQADEERGDYLETVLERTIKGDRAEQDSRVFNMIKARKGRTK